LNELAGKAVEAASARSPEYKRAIEQAVKKLMEEAE
jgi:hypothetical protein